MVFKKILKLITCKSSCISNCSYNNNEFDNRHLDRKLNDYKLKNKDIESIMMILQKRELKERQTYI